MLIARITYTDTTFQELHPVYSINGMNTDRINIGAIADFPSAGHLIDFYDIWDLEHPYDKKVKNISLYWFDDDCVDLGKVKESYRYLFTAYDIEKRDNGQKEKQ